MPHKTSRTPETDYMAPPAAYLRCPNFDPEHMSRYREAMSKFSLRLGAPEPVIYLDNGFCDLENRPALESLAQAARAGRHKLVLVPGLWVFSPEEHRAQRTADLLMRASGCRILRLPVPLKPHRWWSAV